MKEKRLLNLIFFNILFYITPILLLSLGIIPFSFRYKLLYVMTGVLLIYIIIKKYSREDLGIDFDIFNKKYRSYYIVTGTIVVLMILLVVFKIIKLPKEIVWTQFFTFYVFISSPLQEFCCRSVLFAKYRKSGVDNKFITILFTALIFGIMHVPWGDLATVIVTFVMGLIWGYLYINKPNLLLITFSHTILGLASILLGIVK